MRAYTSRAAPEGSDYDLGGRVNANGFRVFVDGDSGITLDALNALLTGKDPS